MAGKAIPKRGEGRNANLSEWRSMLQDIPPAVRIFGFIFVIVEILLAAIIPLSDIDTKKYIAFGMLLIGVLCVVFLGAALLRNKFMAGVEEDTIKIPAPPNEEDEGKLTRFKYDVFVAAPIDSLSNNDERVAQKAAISAIVECIKRRCDFQNVYFAGEQATEPAQYDQPSVGLLHNVQRIRASTYFVLIYPKLLPTSALVEVGMALALGKRSVWFIQKSAKLPYLLSEGGAVGGRSDLPRINIRNYDKLDGILTIIDNDPKQLFNFE